MRRCAFILAVVTTLSLCRSGVSQYSDASSRGASAYSQDDASLKQKFIDALPPAISDNLEIDAWGWLAGLHQPGHHNYWDLMLSLAVTKSFDQRLTISAQGNLISANGEWRLELGQGYLSALPLENSNTILTIGKFNANFGLEPRDFWSRTNGTTSLLFGAQPQDIIGIMVTQPIEDIGLKLRPFITADFQGGYDFDQPPCGGLNVQWQASQQWNFSVTNLIGPGLVLFGGKPLDHPYPADSYGGDPAAVVGNWQGPNLSAERAGTLYYFQATAEWQPASDIHLGAGYLLATTHHADRNFGWSGFMLQGLYDITDRWRAFGRFSYLDDSNWLVTGSFQTRREVSCGLSYSIAKGLEIRGEYRHDFSNSTPDADTWSLHLSFTY